MTDITSIVQILIALCTALITTFLLPWVRTSERASDLTNALKWVEIAVKAAEQIYDQSQGTEKKKYVEQFLEANGIALDVDVIDAAIESAVLELHRKLKEA